MFISECILYLAMQIKMHSKMNMHVRVTALRHTDM
jgi:hypothetical protein